MTEAMDRLVEVLTEHTRIEKTDDGLLNCYLDEAAIIQWVATEIIGKDIEGDDYANQLRAEQRRRLQDE